MVSIDKPSAAVLIIEDDPGVSRTIARIIGGLGYVIEQAGTLETGMNLIRSGRFDVVLLDVNLPDGSGLSVISDVMAMPNHPQIIIMTAYSDPDGAELAIENGAWDYLEKPASPKKLRLQISRAIQFQEKKRAADSPSLSGSSRIVGTSKALKKCIEQVAQVAVSDANVLITGETGTGKELFARMLHDNSRRNKNRFVVVDCSILTENFIESVLFGHEKGAFTGADRKRSGLVALADKGTLFLDEVGELPLSIQSSLLRVLQEKRFRSIGGEAEIASDFRVVCATNKDLDALVKDGSFRSDLLFRLRAVTIELPPLRFRKEDIIELAVFYSESLSERYAIEAKSLSSEFLEALIKYDWPGNVRELINTVESSILKADGEPELYDYHLPQKIRAKIVRASLSRSSTARPETCDSTVNGHTSSQLSHKAAMEQAEKIYLESLHLGASGDIQRMIQTSGLSRAALYRKIKKHQIR